MSKGKKVISKVITILFIFNLVEFILFSYLSPDARYARDNLEYLTGRMEELGISKQIDVRGTNALKWPLPLAAYKTAELSDAWVKGYLSALGEKGIMAREGSLNPYDTLSRLVLRANNPDVETIYNNIQFDEVILFPGIQINSELLKEWLDQKESYSLQAYDAYQNLCHTWGLLGISLLITICCIAVWILILALFPSYEQQEILEEDANISQNHFQQDFCVREINEKENKHNKLSHRQN